MGTHRNAIWGEPGLVAAQNLDWQVRAACRGPQAAVFFPPPRHERKAKKLERERRAKAICDECSVRSACFEYAINIGEQHGIWGGHNELERRRYLRAV